MGPYGELLGAGHLQTLEFFAVGLRDVSDSTVDQDELLYNASVLAHYAQVSRFADSDLPAPANLGDVFDHFVADTTLLADSEMMESAGAQCLLLTGFFETQMRRRYNIGWYVQLGTGFYRRAAAQESAAKKARLLGTIASHFEYWRERHARLSRELDDRSRGRLLLAPPN